MPRFDPERVVRFSKRKWIKLRRAAKALDLTPERLVHHAVDLWLRLDSEEAGDPPRRKKAGAK